MPVFEVELSDGRVIELEADQQPNEQQVSQALQNLPNSSTQPASQPTNLPETSAVGAFGRSFIKGVLPAFAAQAGSKLGSVLGLETGPGALATGFAGAVAAGTGASKLQDAIIHRVIPESEAYDQADVTQHPWASRAGGFLSGGTAFRFQPLRGISALPAFLKGTATAAEREAALALPASAGMGAAAGVVSPLIEGQKPTLGGVAEGVATGLIFGEPRFKGRLATIAEASKTLPKAAEAAAQELARTAQEPPAGVKTPSGPETSQAGGTGEAGATVKGSTEPAKTTPEATPQAETGLSPEDLAYIEAERAALDVPVEVVPDAPAGTAAGTPAGSSGEADPFAQNRRTPGQFMGINRANGSIEVYPGEFSKWLQDVPADRRAEAVRSRLAEERLHLGTKDEQALGYWNNLTSVEKALETKIYTGKWSGKQLFRLNDTQLGHEAVRRRLQQLARMDTSEVAEAARLNRWGLKGLEALNNTVRGMRETLGTKASKEQVAILDRVQTNLNAARSVVASQANPAAINKNSPAEDNLRSAIESAEMGTEFLDKWGHTPLYRYATGELMDAYQTDPVVRDAVKQVLPDTNPKDIDADRLHYLLRDQIDTADQGQPRGALLAAIEQNHPDVLDATVRVSMPHDQKVKEFAIERLMQEGWDRHGAEQVVNDPQEMGDQMPGTSGLKQFIASWVHNKPELGNAEEAGPAAINKGAKPAEGDEFLDVDREVLRSPAAAIADLEARAEKARAKGDRGAAEALWTEAQRLKQDSPGWDQQAFPAALNKRASDVLGMSPEELVKWKQESKYGPKLMRRISSTVTPDDLPKLVAERDRLRQDVAAKVAGSTPETIAKTWSDVNSASLKAQTLNELIENAPKAPAAIRKGAAKDEGTPGFFFGESKASDIPRDTAPIKRHGELELQFVPKGQQVDRAGGFRAPNLDALQSMASHHVEDSSQAPQFERFRGELSSHFGTLVPRDAAFYAWQDALYKKLMGAPGTEIARLADQTGVWKDAARGLKPSDPDPAISRTIADPIDASRPIQRQFEELAKQFEHRKVNTPRAARQKFNAEQRKRYALIGAIADKLTQEAGGAPDKPWSRPQIGPEDIATRAQMLEPGQPLLGQNGQPTGEYAPPVVETAPVWRTIRPEETGDLARIQKLATEGAAVHAEGKQAPPRSVTRTVIAVRDTKTGKIQLLSTWRDPRSGPRVTNPAGLGDKSVKLDGTFLANNRPMVVMQLREPVQHFRQVFDTQQHFDNFFGDIGIEGTEGLHTSSFAGPEAGVANEAMRGSGKSRPEDEPLNLAPDFRRGLPELTGARDLTLPRFARKSVPTGPAPESAPRPEHTPEIGEMSPEPPAGRGPGMWRPVGEGEAELQRQIAPRMPYENRPTADRPVTQTGKPEELQPGWTLRTGLETTKDPAGRPLMSRAPAAINKAVADDLKAVAETFTAAVANRHTSDLVARAFDDASNLPHNLARQVETGIRLLSAVRPRGLAGVTKEWTQGNKQVLSAANALIQSGAVRRDYSIDNHPAGARAKLAIFQRQVANGKAQAEAMMRSGSWRDRRIGRIWARAADELNAELEYARAHWDDPDLQQTASAMKKALDSIHTQMVTAGIDVAKNENYLPGRYDMSNWNGEKAFFAMPRIWGQKWREPKVFPTYYDAIEKGPYVAATRDGASLVNHAYRKGLDIIARNAWLEGLKTNTTPGGLPIAKDAIRRPSGVHVADTGYEPVNVGGKFIAVHEDFAPLIRNLTSKSPFEDSPIPRGLLHMEQLLKHNLLLGDFFHLARMGYYAASIMGRSASWRGGWSALDIAEHDLPEAVRRGVITQAQADWGNEPIRFGRRTLTRRQLIQQAQSNAVGFNVGRIQDALYKDVFTQLTPAAGAVRRGIAAVTDPTTGRYNRFLFDKLTRGLMAESLVSEFERQSAKLPGADPLNLLRDISRDLNNYYGNIGRQGLLKAKWQQDMARMFMLAPQWVEGLAKKELVGYSRLSGISKVTGNRQGLTTLGTTGYGIGRGLLFMVGLTQAINLITRRQPTWKNEEKEHKFDAWIPSWGGRKEGFWLSPMAIFNELTHDVYRLSMAKPKVMDALDTIAGNKESPMLRAALIAFTGNAPGGEYQTTSIGQLRKAGEALAPIPITFGRYGQLAGHTVAPGVIPAPYPGSVQRQVASTLGVKMEPQQSVLAEVANMANDWKNRSGLKKETGWRQEPTDEPGYSKLRQYLRAGDEAGAAKMLQALRKNRTDRDIINSMKLSAKRPFTGSEQTEKQFLYSLDDHGLEKYSQAQARRQEELEQFLDFYLRQP